MLQSTMANYIIIAIEVGAIIGFILNAIRLSRKNKRSKEMLALWLDKTREENLNNMLMNAKSLAANKMSADNPYDVLYHQEEKNVYEISEEKIGLQIEEKGVLSTKKYVVYIYDTITIGAKDSDKIILKDLALNEQQLQLINNQQELFVTCVNCDSDVIITRRKKQYLIGQELVKLNSNDMIQFGNTTLTLTII